MEAYDFSLKETTDEESGYFETKPHFPYMDPFIYYSTRSFDHWKKDGRDMEPHIIHEMIHSLVEPLWEIGIKRYTTPTELKDAGERLTDTLTNIICKLKK